MLLVSCVFTIISRSFSGFWPESISNDILIKYETSQTLFALMVSHLFLLLYQTHTFSAELPVFLGLTFENFFKCYLKKKKRKKITFVFSFLWVKVTQTVCHAPFHIFSSICSHLQKKYKKERRKTIFPFPLRRLKLFCVLGINASFTPVRLISELAGNIMWLNYLCDAWHLLNKMQNTLSASVAMLPLVLSEGWCGNFGQAIK